MRTTVEITDRAGFKRVSLFRRTSARWRLCRRETATGRAGARKDFVILAVSQDRRGRLAVLPFVEKNHFQFDILLDPDNVVGDSYNVSRVPETFIIDRKGRIVAHHMGASTGRGPTCSRH